MCVCAFVCAVHALCICVPFYNGRIIKTLKSIYILYQNTSLPLKCFQPPGRRWGLSSPPRLHLRGGGQRRTLRHEAVFWLALLSLYLGSWDIEHFQYLFRERWHLFYVCVCVCVVQLCVLSVFDCVFMRTYVCMCVCFVMSCNKQTFTLALTRAHIRTDKHAAQTHTPQNKHQSFSTK